MSGMYGIATQASASLAPKPVETSLLDALQGVINIAHERVGRLETLAERVFGAIPVAANNEPPSPSVADALQTTSRALVERLNAVIDRLERIA